MFTINNFIKSIKQTINSTINKKAENPFNTTVSIDKKQKTEESVNLFNTKNVVIYVRASTDNQEINAQKFSCEEYCRNNNLLVKSIYVEKCSAFKNKSQKQLNKLINENENINLIVFSIDRFSRNINKADVLVQTLTQKNINLISIKENINLNTALGKHNFRSYVNAAQYESELISERVKNSVRFRKLNNIPIGKAPYGYIYLKDSNGFKKMIKNDNEYAVIEFISNNLFKERSSDQLTNELYKLLNKLKCDSTQFVPITFTLEDNQYEYENYSGNHKIKIKYNILADVLNDYNIKKQGKLWTSQSISNVFKNISHNELRRLRIA